jgi:hypothetical protein
LTRIELKSLTQRNECAGTESGCLRMLSECLCVSSMCLGVPFIAPRQLEAVEDNIKRLILPSVVWCTGQCGAPPNSHCSCLVLDCLLNKVLSTVAASGPMAHRTVWCPLPTVGAGHASSVDCAADRCADDRWLTGQSGAPPNSHCSCSVLDCLLNKAQSTVAASDPLAHRTVWCPLPTVGAGHATPADCVADRCADDRWLTGQSGAPPDSPVNYSRTPLIFSRERPFHRRQHGAPDSPVCQTELSFGCTEPSIFDFFSSSFLIVSST